MAKVRKKYNGKKVVKLKERKFQMFWEVNEAQRTINMHHDLGDGDSNTATHTPVKIWTNAYEGDLSLALKLRVIAQEQSFHIHSRVTAKHLVTGELITCDYEMAMPEKMDIWRFLGEPLRDSEGNVIPYKDPINMIDEDGELVEWQGFENGLIEFLETIGGDEDDFEVVTNHCILTCYAPFLNFEAERKFMAHKIGLGIGIGMPR